MEGSYFPVAVLRDIARCDTPLWYLDHGSRSLVRSTHCNTIVVRQVIREASVPLAGPSPDTLIDPITVGSWRTEIPATMLGWGREILVAPEQWANRFYQGCLVLNYAGMMHDLVVGYPGPSVLEPSGPRRDSIRSLHDLIDNAWNGRNPAVSVRTPADPVAYAGTLEFVRLIMAEANWHPAALVADRRD